jgi:hypothetical protein
MVYRVAKDSEVPGIRKDDDDCIKPLMKSAAYVPAGMIAGL